MKTCLSSLKTKSTVFFLIKKIALKYYRQYKTSTVHTLSIFVVEQQLSKWIPGVFKIIASSKENGLLKMNFITKTSKKSKEDLELRPSYRLTYLYRCKSLGQGPVCSPYVDLFLNSSRLEQNSSWQSCLHEWQALPSEQCETVSVLSFSVCREKAPNRVD